MNEPGDINPTAQTMTVGIPGGTGAGDSGKTMAREVPNPPNGRRELVEGWIKKVEEARDIWKSRFDRMRDDSRFAAGKQWGAADADSSSYKANITLRHINQRTASIYAKNPRVSAKRKPRIYFEAWDGTQEMLVAAMQKQLPPEVAAQVMNEATTAYQEKKLYDRMGKTLEIVVHSSMDDQKPNFKSQAKQLVRRALTTGIGYIKLGYQRVMEPTPDTDAKINDSTEQLATIEQQTADFEDEEFQANDAKAEELKLNLQKLQAQSSMFMREGLVYSFPRSWSIIPDPAITQLKGFIGARWLAQEYLFTTDQVKRIYKVDVSKSYTAHTQEGVRGDKRKSSDKYCAVYEVYDLDARTCFTVCAGHPEFLKEPGEPDVDLDQFHPYYVYYVNDTEDCDTVYPPSDVELLRPMQMEYNRSREALRQHRIANRPAYVSAKGVFDEATKDKLATHADHELIETNASKADNIDNLLRAKPTVPISSELYDVEPVFADSMRVTGDQEANLGGTSGATATESTIAETSRTTSIQSCIDELDEFLSEVLRDAGKVALLNMDKATVQRIAGPGAAWPEFSREEVAEELYVEIKAGSSGRPNKAGRIAAIEKTMPFLLQIPGLKPRKLADMLLGEIDEGIELDDFADESLPAIVAMNAMSKPNLAAGPGNIAQAAAGSANAAAPDESAGKTQNTLPMGMPEGGGAGQQPALTA